MSKKLIILGASGHGKVAADIALRSGYDEILFLDDNPEVRECLGRPVAGRRLRRRPQFRRGHRGH